MILHCQWCTNVAKWRLNAHPTESKKDDFTVVLCEPCKTEAVELPIVSENDEWEFLGRRSIV